MKGSHLSFLLLSLVFLLSLWVESSDQAGGLMYLERALTMPDDDSSGIEGVPSMKKADTTQHKTTTPAKKGAHYGTLGKKKAASKKKGEEDPRFAGLSKEVKEFLKRRKVEGPEGIEEGERQYDMRLLQKLTLLNMVDTMRTKYGAPLFSNENNQRDNGWMSQLLEQFKGTQGEPNSFTANFSRQIEGDYRGGLIPFTSLEWEYSARDVSQDNGPVPPRRKKASERVDLQLTPTGNPLSNNLFGNNEDGIYFLSCYLLRLLD